MQGCRGAGLNKSEHVGASGAHLPAKLVAQSFNAFEPVVDLLWFAAIEQRQQVLGFVGQMTAIVSEYGVKERLDARERDRIGELCVLDHVLNQRSSRTLLTIDIRELCLSQGYALGVANGVRRCRGLGDDHPSDFECPAQQIDRPIR